MSYWWPPSLFAFDPSERAFDWHLEKVEGKNFNALVPSDVDLELLNCLPVSFMPYAKKHGVLSTYEEMIALRTPGDPAKGGLKPDRINSDGSITIGYFDFSDEDKVRRKEVTYVMNPKTGQPEIANRNSAEGGLPQEWIGRNGVGHWEKEGPDAERELGKATLPILSAIGSIASAVMSVAGLSFAAGVFAAMWGFVLQSLKNGGRPPSVDDVLGFAKAVGGAAGPGVWGILSKNEDLQRLLKDGFIAKMSKLPGTYADKVAAVSSDLAAVLPRLPLGTMFPNFSSSDWAKGLLKAGKVDLSQIKLGTAGIEEIPLSSYTDSRRDAFEPAMRAFAEPDPAKRAAIRRNFLWCVVENSSAIWHGNPQSAGAHNEVERDVGILGAGSYFDQYLAAMNASLLADIEARAGVGVISTIEETRRRDPEAKKALYDLVGDLRDRYRMI
jgi:hypothetical protein